MTYWGFGAAFVFVCITQGPAIAFSLSVLCLTMALIGPVLR